MKNKSKLLYNILVAITFLLPISVYVLIEALIHQVDYDYTVYGEIADLTHLDIEDGIFIYTDNKDVYFHGLTVFNNDVGTYGIELKDNEVLRVGNKFYNWRDGEFKDVKAELIKKKQSYSIPTFIIFMGLGILIAVGIISRKMQWHKEHPREATLIALWSAVLIFFVINFFISNILWSLIVIAGSFTVYYIEHLVFKGEMTKKEQAKQTSAITDELKKLLGNKK